VSGVERLPVTPELRAAMLEGKFSGSISISSGKESNWPARFLKLSGGY